MRTTHISIQIHYKLIKIVKAINLCCEDLVVRIIRWSCPLLQLELISSKHPPPGSCLETTVAPAVRTARVYQTSQPVHVTAVYYLLFVPPGHSQKTTAPWWPQPTPASAPPRESWSTARQPNSAWRRYQVLQVNTYAERSSRVISLCVGVCM